jgi:hypothetical protein
VALTHLSTTLVARDDRSLAELVERTAPPRADRARFAAAVNAGTIDDHIGRLRELAEAGVSEVMLSLPNLADEGALEPLRQVISAFR